VKSRISLNNAIIFLKQNKKFILRCYQYSKSQTSSKLQDYFPLSIISEKPNNQVHVLILESVINEIQNYFDVYREFYQINSKIEFISDFNVIKSVLSEDEMHQLLISIIYNVQYFNKNNTKIQNISLEIKEDRIIIFSSGVKLNQKYAIQASELIFYESVNPYLLKLGQILVLLARHGIECEIVPESNGTSISIIFAESIASSLQKDNVVINFKQRKHKK
jgi:glutaredoxin-related protein